MYFAYGPQQTEYLKARDPVLGELIDRIGPIRRKVDPDLFSSVVHHIVGQQISTKEIGRASCRERVYVLV